MRGYSLLEVMIALFVSALLATMAVPIYAAFVDRARAAQAIADIGVLEMRIERFRSNGFQLPDQLTDLPQGNLTDPWGNPYRYLRIEGNGNPGVMGLVRKDRNLNPINSDFDLYSAGEDGLSVPALTAARSRDDVVRAGNGSFVGPAAEF